MMLLDVLNKLDSESKSAHIEKLAKIHTLIPPDTPERQLFVAKAINTTKSAEQTAGVPELHRQIAHTLWKGRFRTNQKH